MQLILILPKNVRHQIRIARGKLVDEGLYNVYDRGFVLLDKKKEGDTHSFSELWPNGPQNELAEYATTGVLKNVGSDVPPKFVLPFSDRELWFLRNLSEFSEHGIHKTSVEFAELCSDDYNDYVEPVSIRMYKKSVVKKLKASGLPYEISSIRGKGYLLREKKPDVVNMDLYK